MLSSDCAAFFPSCIILNFSLFNLFSNSSSMSASKFPLELVYSDVWGPTPESVGRKKYYVSFIDDFSKFTWIYLIKFKSEVFQKFQEFQAFVERQFNRKILAVQTDWG